MLPASEARKLVKTPEEIADFILFQIECKIREACEEGSHYIHFTFKEEIAHHDPIIHILDKKLKDFGYGVGLYSGKYSYYSDISVRW
jgi:hypothetical protein